MMTNETQQLKIFAPDDSHTYNTTNVTVAGHNMTWDGSYQYRPRWYKDRNNSIQPSHYRSANEPTIEGIKTWLKNYLRWGVKGRPTFKGMFIIVKGMKKANIHCMKVGTTYMIQGMATTKDTAITAIARTVQLKFLMAFRHRLLLRN